MTTTTTSHGPGRPHPDRRGLKPGAEVSVAAPNTHGARYTVHRIIGREVTCFGGKPGKALGWRTFTVDQIKTVHYRKPQREAARPARLKTKPVTKRAPHDIAKGQAPTRKRRNRK